MASASAAPITMPTLFLAMLSPIPFRAARIVHKGLSSGEAQIAIDVQMHSRQGTAPAAVWGRCCLRAIMRSKYIGEKTECAVAGC
jgi:hypothetical protein